ncbi:MAG: dephospho-CoA kinase [Firmicutes bacterium]|nr:dephospho-CoA kinase [Bacillota bacterium]
MTQNKIIGVTGITGSGTSTVSAILQELGGFVIYADKLAHEVILKGQPAYKKIIEVFGREILDPKSCEINRKALGALVFGKPDKLAVLESVIHPEVIAITHRLLTGAQSFPFSVIDAPLLIESDMYKICDSVWLVTAADDIRLARIMSRDGIDNETAMRRIKSRAGDSFLRPYADVIIKNNTDLESLRQTVAALALPAK